MTIRFGLKRLTSIALWGAIAALPALGTTTFVVSAGAGTGNERCLTGSSGNGGNCDPKGNYSGLTSMVQLFANSQGLTLTRVDDSFDQIWTTQASAGVFGLARSAARDFTLGVIPGDTGGSYTSVLAVIGSSSAPQEFLPSIPAGQNANNDLVASSSYDVNGRPMFTGISEGSDFRFAIQQVTSGTPDLWSSNPADNRDSTDHMVTWQLHGSYLDQNSLVWYVAGFENAAFPASDGDYNDYAFVFQNVQNQTPEPSTGLLAGLALIALAITRVSRERSTSN